MTPTGPSSQPDPEQHRPELLRQAARALPRWLGGKVAPSDVVQQALINFWGAGDRARELSPEEQAAWLSRAVNNVVLNLIREFFRLKRDVRRERPLVAPGESAAALAASLAAAQSTPSQRADRHEQEARLAEAIGALPDDQRAAVVMRHLEGASMADIADALGRSEAAVGGLLRRGLEKLRESLAPAERGE
jgi:RNA polymerase sigma-70 factor (ECF subfamily)